MSHLGDSWNRKHTLPGPLHSFEKWGPPPPIVQIPAGRPENFPLSSVVIDYADSGIAYAPTLVIGLGETGHQVLEQWIGQLPRDSDSAFSKLRVLTVSVQHHKEKKQDWVEARQLILGDNLPNSASTASATQSSRLQALSLFLEAGALRYFHEWLHSCLMTLQRNIQVFVLASAAEPEISLVGPILQILRLKPETSSPYSNLIVMLSLTSVSSVLTIAPAESYASLREISRLTYSGPHKMTEMPLLRESIVRSALIDHLFIFDESQPRLRDNSIPMRFENGLGQSMAEVLYNFCHPASQPFWEHAQNDASTLGHYRYQLHEPVISAVGVRTLHVPLAEMQAFLAARLSQAVIFGDDQRDLREQLIPPGVTPPADPKTIETLARNWLIDKDPNFHPVFEWLWTIQSPQDLRTLPDFSYEFKDLYAAKLSYRLVRFLNEPDEIDKLRTAVLVIKVQEQRFVTLLDWMQRLPPDAEAIMGQQKFLDILTRWQKTAQSLVNSVSEWQKVLSNPRENLASENSSKPASDLSLLWTSKRHSSDWSKPKDDLLSPPRAQSLYKLLSAAKYRARQSLIENSYSAVRVALNGDMQDPLREVDRYYKDSVRPELSQYGMGISEAYRWLRNRLMWWIRLEPGREPELLLVCWPGDITAEWNTHPPDSACYSVFDIERLSEAILELAAAQLRGMRSDLTGAWFQRRLKETAPKIQSTTEAVFLDYDENAVIRLVGSEIRRYYLTARDKGLTGVLSRIVFPDRLPGQINELGGGDPSRFSSMTIRAGIPISAINRIREWYPAYNHLARLHQYSQEKLAARYENLIRLKCGKRVMIPPEVTMLLTDEQLVTLFCQALYCGLIYIGYDELQKTQKWLLQSVADFPPLPLADNNADGVLNAFRNFTLELPNPSGVGQNPNAHFHVSRRKQFLEALRKETRAIRQANSKLLRDEFSHGLLVDLKARGEQDEVMQAFAYILEMEIDEPAWKGWWD